jgi:peptide/nickel transport system permease protein
MSAPASPADSLGAATDAVVFATTQSEEKRRRLGGSFGVMFWAATAWLVVVVLCAVFASWMPFDHYKEVDMPGKLEGPSWRHLFGTDALGRDTLARLVHGSRVSVVVSLSAVAIGMTVGGLIGMTVGFFRGRVEKVSMALIDVILAFPGLILLLALVAFVGQSLSAIALSIGFLSIPVYTRVARANTLRVAQREFVLAARAMGATRRRLLFAEIFPNVVLSVLAYGLVAMGVVIILEGSLAFLGLSVQAPAPTWGGMIAEAKRHLNEKPLVPLFPALTMFFTVLSLNLVGDRLRTHFDIREANAG